MPIIKRSRGTVEVATTPTPAPKPKTKGSALIVKRTKPPKSLIYFDRGILVVKTPKDCTNWPNEFRVRLVRDYLAPKTLCRSDDLKKRGIDQVYTVQGKKVMFSQPSQALDGTSNMVVVLRTEIIDVDSKRAMFLSHADPAMRVLMVYLFLTGTTITGAPEFETYEWRKWK